jgi:hypothetical protein
MIKSVANPKKNIFMSLFEIFIFIVFNYLLKYIKLIKSKIEKVGLILIKNQNHLFLLNKNTPKADNKTDTEITIHIP